MRHVLLRKFLDFYFNAEMIPTEMLSSPFTVALILWKHTHKLMELQFMVLPVDLVNKNEYINVFVINLV